MFPHKGVQKLKSIIDIMDQKSVSIFEAKKLALQQGDEAVLRQVGEGKDIMSILSAPSALESRTLHSLSDSEGEYGSIRRR